MGIERDDGYTVTPELVPIDKDSAADLEAMDGRRDYGETCKAIDAELDKAERELLAELDGVLR